MQTKDIKARTWYGTKEKYAMPKPVLVNDTSRYSSTGWNYESTQIFANPDGNMAQGRRFRSGGSTGFLAVRLQGDAQETVQRWAIFGEDEQAAKDIMTEAALLLDKAVAEIATRGKVPLKELRQPENDERGLVLSVVHPKELDDEYVAAVRERHDHEEAAKKAREAQESAIQARYDHMVTTLVRAKRLGLNTDRFKGGVSDSPNSYGRHTKVEMNVETFDQILDELERLRALAGETLRADEVGEGRCGQ